MCAREISMLCLVNIVVRSSTKKHEETRRSAKRYSGVTQISEEVRRVAKFYAEVRYISQKCEAILCVTQGYQEVFRSTKDFAEVQCCIKM